MRDDNRPSRVLASDLEHGAIQMKARRLLLATALATASAFAAQNFDVSGKDFHSGAGDAKFAAIGRQAAAAGKRVVVTAPQQWHARIAAKLRAGGATDIVLNDGFYETVLVRIEDKPAPKPEPKAEPKPEPRPAPKAEPKAEPRPAPKPVAPPPEREARVPAEVPGPKPTPPPPEPPPAPIAAPAPAPASRQAVPAAATPAPSARPAPAKPDVAAIQKRLEQSLNNGREAEGPISVSGLQSGDFIFVDGPVRAVVRRESLRPRMFWLDGDLDLRRTELKELGANRYQVIEPIRGGSYTLREERADKTFAATMPPANSPGRAALERDYNDGHSIDETIAIDQLRAGDIIYTGKGMAVVVRRERQALQRYWLEGALDLSQAGLQQDGANKYKVVSDTLR
jgi:hypothetical protein